MARSKAATKKAKAEYTARYRKEHADKVAQYNKKTIDERSSRNKARAMMVKKLGKSAVKGKEIHHVDSNPKNDSGRNLKVAPKGHGGGVKGNNNAVGSHKLRRKKK